MLAANSINTKLIAKTILLTFMY